MGVRFGIPDLVATCGDPSCAEDSASPAPAVPRPASLLSAREAFSPNCTRAAKVSAQATSTDSAPGAGTYLSPAVGTDMRGRGHSSASTSIRGPLRGALEVAVAASASSSHSAGFTLDCTSAGGATCAEVLAASPSTAARAGWRWRGGP